MREKEELLLFCIYSLLQAALRTHGVIDVDVMPALEALIRTRQTLDSGLLYESYPQNTLAAEVQRRVTASLEDYEREQRQEEALHPVRNSDFLAILVLLHRLGQQQSRPERPRSRLFVDLLRQMTPDGGGVKEPVSGIII